MNYSKNSLGLDQIRVLFPEVDGRRMECDRYQKILGLCTCCKFSKKLGNWIGHLPSELEEARRICEERGLKDYMKHLIEIEELPQGGHSSRCNFHPSQGHNVCLCKPLDCRMYPIFPKRINLETLEIEWIVGIKCPMRMDEIRKTIIVWYPRILKLCLERPELVKWFEETAKGYKGYVEIEKKEIHTCDTSARMTF